MHQDKEILIVGDLHGQIETALEACKYADGNNLQIIFLGDLTDSFSKTVHDQRACLELVLTRLKKGDFCIIGNHDMFYLYPNKHACSGFSEFKLINFRGLYIQLKDHPNFVPYVYLENKNILITHAGLTNTIVPKEFETSPVKYIEKEKDSIDSPIYKSKGITWLRTAYYHPLNNNNIRQIVGHTPSREIICLDNLWIADTIEYGNKSLLKITSDGDIMEINYEYNTSRNRA